MKRIFHLFSAAMVLALVISLARVTSVPARGGATPTWTPTAYIPDWTPTADIPPDWTPTAYIPDWTPTAYIPDWTPTADIPPDWTPTAYIPDWTPTADIPPGSTLTPYPGWTPTPQTPPASVPAVLAIIRTDRNPTYAPRVSFIVIFSEPVTGVDAQDFAVKTTGQIKGATVSNVIGFGNMYMVTVDTGRGKGTLRLDVPVTATITNQAGNPLGVLPFENGEVYSIRKGHWR